MPIWNKCQFEIICRDADGLVFYITMCHKWLCIYNVSQMTVYCTLLQWCWFLWIWKTRELWRKVLRWVYVTLSFRAHTPCEQVVLSSRRRQETRREVCKTYVHIFWDCLKIVSSNQLSTYYINLYTCIYFFFINLNYHFVKIWWNYTNWHLKPEF